MEHPESEKSRTKFKKTYFEILKKKLKFKTLRLFCF